MKQVGSMVRHINPVFDMARGKMKIIEIKDQYALCGCGCGFNRYVYFLKDLKSA
jgi:CDGSH-type Zn-finger protein